MDREDFKALRWLCINETERLKKAIGQQEKRADLLRGVSQALKRSYSQNTRGWNDHRFGESTETLQKLHLELKHWESDVADLTKMLGHP